MTALCTAASTGVTWKIISGPNPCRAGDGARNDGDVLEGLTFVAETVCTSALGGNCGEDERRRAKFDL